MTIEKIKEHDAHKGTIKELLEHFTNRSKEHNLKQETHEGLLKQILLAPANIWHEVKYIVEKTENGVTHLYTKVDLIFKHIEDELNEDSPYL